MNKELQDQKQVLRKEARAHRVRMDLRAEDIDKAADLFMEKIDPQKGQVVSAYFPQDKEFDCFPLLEALAREEIDFALPVIIKGSRVLKFARWALDDKLERGEYGIPHPHNKEWVEPDIVLVPMLAFDRRGVRLGQGGGFYDATLANLRARKSVQAVGLAYAQQACLFPLPREEHDQKLDWIITPQEAHCYV